MLAIDKIWGIEREKTSEFFGLVVVETAILWDRPGGVWAATNEEEDGEIDGPQVTGALTHGAEVFVIGQAIFNDFKWSSLF